MPLQNRENDPGSDASADRQVGPGEGPMGPAWILAVSIYLVVASVIVMYGLIKLWPYPTPSGEAKVEGQATPSPTPAAQAANPSGATTAPAQGSAPASASAQTSAAAQPPAPGARTATQPAAAGQTTGPAGTSPTTAPQTQLPAASPSPAPPKRELPDPEPMSFFGGWIKANIYLETRLLLLVMLAGALGSLLHSLRSLYWYTGNRMMVWSWVAFYLLLPFTGAILSVVFYFVVRGGFFSPQASFDHTSPFGFAALSALVGLFSPQATLKLKEVAETIFTKPGAGTDAKAQPASAQVPPETPPPAAAASGDAVEELDGHDAEITADTPDENLPITEGGVG